MASEASDSSGMRFFSRSPFRSGFFLTELVFSSAIVAAGVAMLILYSSRLGPGAEILLVLSCLSSVFAILGAWSRHSEVQEAYFLGAAAELSSESPVHPALDTAAKAIRDGLYRSNTLATSVIIVLAFSLHRSTARF